MRILTLLNKGILRNKDGDTLKDKVDLFTPSLTSDSQIPVVDYHYVRPDDVMRPDLISAEYYGSPNYWDIILKFNNISNPFSINEGMILRIPDLQTAKTRAKNTNKQNNKSNAPREQFSPENKRISEKDKARLEYLRQRSEQKKNGSSQNLPPNMLKDGEKRKTFEDGVILLGSNINRKQ